MRKKMKKLVALLTVMSLTIGLAQLTQGRTAEAAGKYKLKVKNLTMELGEESKKVNVKTSGKMKAGGKIGTVAGYMADVWKYKVVSGKDKISVDKEYGDIKAKKVGTAKIKVTVVFHQYINNGESWAKGKKLATLSKTIKVTVKKPGEIPKSECKVSDKNIELSAGSNDMEIVDRVYNKKFSAYAYPVVTYKVISGEECVEVKDSDSGTGAYLYIYGLSEGTAVIQVNITWEKYRFDKHKLLDKSYATSSCKFTVNVTGGDEDEDEEE